MLPSMNQWVVDIDTFSFPFFYFRCLDVSFTSTNFAMFPMTITQCQTRDDSEVSLSRRKFRLCDPIGLSLQPVISRLWPRKNISQGHTDLQSKTNSMSQSQTVSEIGRNPPKSHFIPYLGKSRSYVLALVIKCPQGKWIYNVKQIPRL